MSVTAQQLINSSLSLIGRLGPGRTPGPSESANCLLILNGMIDGLGVNRGNVFTERIDTWTLSIGQQTYTIGVDPTGVQTPTLAPGDRPNKLTRANLLLPAGGNTVRVKINLLTKDQWATKAVQNVAGLPLDLYNDGAAPLSTYYIYQIPDQAYQIETYSWQDFKQLAALTTVLALPQGYLEYFTYALAVRLAPLYAKTLTPEAMAIYMQSRAEVQALNALSPRIVSDAGLDAGGGGYNWLSGLNSD